MMRSAVIALFLIVIGGVAGVLGASGVIPADSVSSITTADSFDYATVKDITEGGAAGVDGLLGGLSSIGNIFKIIFNAILNALWVAPMLEGFGLPAALAYCIQIPIWFIYVYDMVNWIGNRNPTT